MSPRLRNLSLTKWFLLLSNSTSSYIQMWSCQYLRPLCKHCTAHDKPPSTCFSRTQSAFHVFMARQRAPVRTGKEHLMSYLTLVLILGPGSSDFILILHSHRGIPLGNPVLSESFYLTFIIWHLFLNFWIKNPSYCKLWPNHTLLLVRVRDMVPPWVYDGYSIKAKLHMGRWWQGTHTDS